MSDASQNTTQRHPPPSDGFQVQCPYCHQIHGSDVICSARKDRQEQNRQNQEAFSRIGQRLPSPPPARYVDPELARLRHENQMLRIEIQSLRAEKALNWNAQVASQTPQPKPQISSPAHEPRVKIEDEETVGVKIEDEEIVGGESTAGETDPLAGRRFNWDLPGGISEAEFRAVPWHTMSNTQRRWNWVRMHAFLCPEEGCQKRHPPLHDQAKTRSGKAQHVRGEKKRVREDDAGDAENQPTAPKRERHRSPSSSTRTSSRLPQPAVGVIMLQ